MEKGTSVNPFLVEDVVKYRINTTRVYRYTPEQLGHHGVIKKVFTRHVLVKWASKTRPILHPITSVVLTRRPGQ